MPRYIVHVSNNTVTSVEEAGASEDELLGLEWALSELKDSWNHARKVDGDYSLTDEGERDSFLAAVGALIGPAALGAFA